MWGNTLGLWVRPAEEFEVCAVFEDDEFVAGGSFGMGAAFYDGEVGGEPGWGCCEVGGRDEDDDVVELDGFVLGCGGVCHFVVDDGVVHFEDCAIRHKKEPH